MDLARGLAGVHGAKLVVVDSIAQARLRKGHALPAWAETSGQAQHRHHGFRFSEDLQFKPVHPTVQLGADQELGAALRIETGESLANLAWRTYDLLRR